MHDKVWPLRGGQHAHERSVEKLLSVPSTSTLANTDLSAGKRRHGLGTPELELLGKDKDALSPLPPAAFSCVRWETGTCSKQGAFTVGGPHRYSAGPAWARRRVDVALGAFDVTVCDASTGEAVATHGREWGEAPTDSSDPTLQLRLFVFN